MAQQLLQPTPTPRIAKFQNDTLDYVIKWGSWLASCGDSPADAIVNASFNVANGLTLQSSSFTANSTTVWLSGGTIGQVYLVVCTVTTAHGRTKTFDFEIQVTNPDVCGR